MPSGSTRPLRTRRLRGPKYEFYVIPADIMVLSGNLAASTFTGANSGTFLFHADVPMDFLGIAGFWGTAGGAGEIIRVKKVLAAATSVAGAAADANNIDLTGSIALDATAGVVRWYEPLTTGVKRLAAGDKIAVASAAGVTGLATARFQLRFGVI